MPRPHKPPRLDLVAKYREQLASGTYRMPSDEELAEAMLRYEGFPMQSDTRLACACGEVKAHPTAAVCRQCDFALRRERRRVNG